MNSLQAFEEARFNEVGLDGKLEEFDDSILYISGKPILKTGSRRFKVNNELSDYDYVILDEDLEYFENYLKELNFVKTEEETAYTGNNRLKNTRSIKMSLGLLCINLITYETIGALVVINGCNKYMSKLTKSLIKDKDVRCLIFEDYIDNFMTDEILTTKKLNFCDSNIVY